MRAGSIAVGAARHGLQTAIEALLIIAIIVTLAFAGALVTGAASPGGADAVLAAKGGNGGGGGGKPGGSGGDSTIRLVHLDSTDGVVHYGQRVDFEVSTTATDRPNVRVNCYEGGVWVYTDMTGKYEGYPWPGHVFTLKWDPYHTAGASADCTASLFYFTRRGEKTLASLSFDVHP